MYYPEKIKQAPITGLAGFGGGASGLGINVFVKKATFDNGGDRALAMGGHDGSWPSYGGISRIDYWDIATNSGSVSDFGDVSSDRTYAGACSDSSRGVMMGGRHHHNGDQNIIDYVTIASTGNSTDFGDLGAIATACTGLSDATRGVCVTGKYNNVEYAGVIEYITIQTTGNATDFGDMVTSNGGLGNPDGGSDGITGIYAGGYVSSGGSEVLSDAMEYITIATIGNATDWGDLIPFARAWPGGAGNHEKCLWCGGNASGTYTNAIVYSIYTTIGSCTDFGDLTGNRSYMDGQASETRAVFTGGYKGSSQYEDEIEYITIATTGNATDWGDLHDESYGHGTCSGDAS